MASLIDKIRYISNIPLKIRDRNNSPQLDGIIIQMPQMKRDLNSQVIKTIIQFLSNMTSTE